MQKSANKSKRSSKADPVEHYYEKIEGWMRYEDTYREAVRTTPDGGTIVEVGSFLGRSAAFMAVEIANSGKDLRFVCVDPFNGNLGVLDGQKLIDKRCTVENFRRNVNSGGAGHLIETLVGFSVDVAANFPDASIDFVFIDAAHDYPNVRADLCAWLPKVKHGGIIAGHDYGDGWPMVRVAVQEVLSWRNVEERADSVFWFKNIAHGFGNWLSRPEGDADYLLHIPYVNRPDLLRKAIDSLTAEERRNTYIIDQSVDGFDSAGLGIGHYRGMKKVPFSQMMNWTLDVARFDSKSYSLFMHNDVSCAPGTVTRLVERARLTPAPWGALFAKDDICYDYLSVFNLEAIRAVGRWDETFPWYVGDRDFYRRLQIHRQPIVECADIPVSHGFSQTIASDSAIRTETRTENVWALAHYEHKWGGQLSAKWGGPPAERFTTPYNGRP